MPGQGVAYTTYSSGHLLNVVARNMSALPDHPSDFVEWLHRREEYRHLGTPEINQLYAPRTLYGIYLRNKLDELKNKFPLRFTIVPERIIGCRLLNGSIELTSSTGKQLVFDKVVLATGNFLPGKPKGIPQSFTSSTNYFNDPWSEKSVSNLSGELPVLIVGTGLTMVDVVIGISEKRKDQKIIAISPKGFEILSHKQYEHQPAILDDLKPPYQLDELVRLFRSHLRAVWKLGITGETVVDAIRSKTQEIWTSLTPTERKRFLSHLRHLWGLARHRLPEGIHSIIRQLRQRGQLIVLAGRIIDVHEDSNSIAVTYQERSTKNIRELQVSRVINCTGPQTNVERLTDPLFIDLLKNGIVQPDPLGMGISCDLKGHPIDSTGSSIKKILAIGSLLKGDLWESTAVPELRAQASAAAKELFS